MSQADQETAARRNFATQAKSCRELGSPFTGLVCELLGERLDASSRFGARILAWPGNANADALALRAAGAFNALARNRSDAGLTAAYPPNPTDPEALWTALAGAIARHDAFLHDYLDSAPQTNEVRRSSALLGGALIVAREFGLPLDLIEIGASAGLNLGFERYRYELGAVSCGPADAAVTIRSEWRGGLPEIGPMPQIGRRRACDLNPLDPGSHADRERVLSYIWPDQAQRVETTEAAFAFAASLPWRVERADAAAWVEARLAETTLPGHVRMLMHTIMWQYLPQPTKDRIASALHAAGAAATGEIPLAWLRMEADGAKDAAVTLTTWPDGAEREIARADFHGRWVEWR